MKKEKKRKTERNLIRHTEPFTRSQISSGLAVMAVFIIGMCSWSFLAPLGSAAIAPGIVSVESYRKAIQHLEGGIVEKIHVADGAKVKLGDLLISLRDVAAVSNAERIKTQYFEALAGAARLTAERDSQLNIAFPNELTSKKDAAALAAITAQLKIFDSRRQLQYQKLAVIDKRIDRLKEEKEALFGQIKAVSTQIELFDQQRRDTEALYDKQLTRKSRVNEVQRDQARIEGKESELKGEIAQIEQQIVELELRKSELLATTIAAIVDELRTRQARAHELSQELVAAQDVLGRTRIVSPFDGTVVGLKVHSKDGVIAPGATLMEIVPLSDDLIIEARLRPEDIEDVRAGLPAFVVLNTLTRRYSQPIKATLDSVSADRLIDGLTGLAYYLVRVRPDEAAIDPNDTKLLAGMSADVFIQTGERTAFAYLMSPILRTFNRGMREN